MILIRTQIQDTSGKQQAASFIVDIEPYIWDNMILINERITHDIRRKKILPRVTNSIRCFGNEAQEPARLRLWDDPAAARAGRPVRRGAGMHHQLAASFKLRGLHAIAAGPDGRGASGVRARRTGARVPQEEVQGPGLINRGLRAPTPRNKLQAASYKRQATSGKLQAASSPAQTKHQAASDKLQAPSRKLQAPGPQHLHKVSGSVARGS
jgi:hypothetical protein